MVESTTVGKLRGSTDERNRVAHEASVVLAEVTGDEGVIVKRIAPKAEAVVVSTEPDVNCAAKPKANVVDHGILSISL